MTVDQIHQECGRYRKWIAEYLAQHDRLLASLPAFVSPAALTDVEWHDTLLRGVDLSGSTAVAGNWTAVRARSQEIARALGAKTWRRRSTLSALPAYEVRGSVGGVSLMVEVFSADGAAPESCRYEDRRIEAQPERIERVLVCGMPVEEEVSAAEEVARA